MQSDPEPGEGPPYPPASMTANFRHYTASRFSLDDQKLVASFANKLKTNGCSVIISNIDDTVIRELYSGWYIHTLPVTRFIAANGSRGRVVELVITSYPTS